MSASRKRRFVPAIRGASGGWVSGAPAILAALAGVAVVWAIDALPLIPSWEPLTAMLAGATIAVVVTIVGIRIMSIWRVGNRWAALAITTLTSFPVVLMWFLFTELLVPNALYSEDVVATLADRRSGETLYVYETSDIPDGFVHTRVAVRRGWLPLERTLLVLGQPFDSSVQGIDGLELRFGIDRAVRYDYLGRR
jgi:hypothetical protein